MTASIKKKWMAEVSLAANYQRKSACILNIYVLLFKIIAPDCHSNKKKCTFAWSRLWISIIKQEIYWPTVTKICCNRKYKKETAPNILLINTFVEQLCITFRTFQTTAIKNSPTLWNCLWGWQLKYGYEFMNMKYKLSNNANPVTNVW